LKDIGAQLRNLRKTAGKSLREIERLTGIKAMVLSSYERGDRAPTIYKVSEILSYYGKALAIVDSEDQYKALINVPKTAEDIANHLEEIAHQIRNNGVS
jgi:transcriptional regulator with XRE-family HTH domain